jgi:hypothetical protein
MVDWNNANGMQMRMVHDALLDAFRNPSDLKMLLRLNLDESYAENVSSGGNYANEVFDVVQAARQDEWLAALVREARRERPGNRRVAALLPLADLTEATPSPSSPRTLEDIVRDEVGFTDLIPWISGLDLLRGQVCRIESPVNQAVGTGWLVAPDLLLTNWHVVARVISNEKAPASVVCRFDYASDAEKTNPGTEFGLAADWCPSYSPASPREIGNDGEGPGPKYLDYALLRLAQPVGDQAGPSGAKRGWVATKRGVTAPPAGAVVLVLQHPSGDPLKIAIGVVKEAANGNVRILHDANTLHGSSGSPCLNAKLELVALHNAGDPMYDDGNGAPKQNQAVPLEPILASIDATANAPKFWSA